MRTVLLWLLLQSADPSPKFEAVTIKPPNASRYNVYGHLATWGLEYDGCTGGPGTPDPLLLRCNVTLANLLVTAYQLAPIQFAPPEWMESTIFNIEARVPVGATPEQVRLMEQNLLAERFKLAVHFVRKDVPAYEMAVAKQGPKFNAASNIPKPDRASGQAPPIWRGRVHVETLGSMDQLVRFLSAFTGLPVFDGTGLTGKYDIDLTFGDSMPWMLPPFSAPLPDGPPLAAALRDQLGLVLERTK